MKFTMARPEVSCHPGEALPEASTVVSAALCYYAPEPDSGRGEGRLPRYTWIDEYAELREKLHALGRRLGGEYRVLVDENQHVDREAAARAGVGFYGKNTLLITKWYGSWVVLGTLVTQAEIEPTPPSSSTAGRAPSASTRARRGHWTSPARSTRRAASRTGRSRPPRFPEEYRAEIGGMVYGCDICQDVCPWNRGIEKRRTGRQLHGNAEPTVSLVDWLEADGEELVTRYDRLYVPRKDPRYLRRNALVAAGNARDPALREAVEAHARQRRPTPARARRVGSRTP